MFHCVVGKTSVKYFDDCSMLKLNFVFSNTGVLSLLGERSTSQLLEFSVARSFVKCNMFLYDFV